MVLHDDVYFSKEQGLIVGLRKHKSVRNSGEFKIPEFDNADGKWLKKKSMAKSNEMGFRSK